MTNERPTLTTITNGLQVALDRIADGSAADAEITASIWLDALRELGLPYAAVLARRIRVTAAGVEQLGEDDVAVDDLAVAIRDALFLAESLAAFETMQRGREITAADMEQAEAERRARNAARRAPAEPVDEPAIPTDDSELAEAEARGVRFGAHVTGATGGRYLVVSDPRIAAGAGGQPRAIVDVLGFRDGHTRHTLTARSLRGAA